MTTDGLFMVLGITLAAAGLLLLLWALFKDRARGRRRCPRCWYDMSAVNGLTCPECGRTAKRESRLLRTRRRWGWALAGVMVLAAAFPAMRASAIRDEGLWGVVPDPAWRALRSLLAERLEEEWDRRFSWEAQFAGAALPPLSSFEEHLLAYEGEQRLRTYLDRPAGSALSETELAEVRQVANGLVRLGLHARPALDEMWDLDQHFHLASLGPSLPQVVPMLAAAAESVRDELQVSGAVNALAGLVSVDPRARRAFLGLLRSEQDAARRHAMSAVINLGPAVAEVEPLLVERAERADDDERRLALRALASVRGLPHPELLTVLYDPTAFLWTRDAHSLAGTYSLTQSSPESLAQQLLEDPDALERRLAAVALHRYRHRLAAQDALWQAALDDEDADVRLQCFVVLAQGDSSDVAVEAHARWLADSDATVRSIALRMIRSAADGYGLDRVARIAMLDYLQQALGREEEARIREQMQVTIDALLLADPSPPPRLNLDRIGATP